MILRKIFSSGTIHKDRYKTKYTDYWILEEQIILRLYDDGLVLSYETLGYNTSAALELNRAHNFKKQKLILLPQFLPCFLQRNLFAILVSDNKGILETLFLHLKFGCESLLEI